VRVLQFTLYLLNHLMVWTCGYLFYQFSGPGGGQVMYSEDISGFEEESEEGALGGAAAERASYSSFNTGKEGSKAPSSSARSRSSGNKSVVSSMSSPLI
jgi:hypothetical protein